MVNTSEQDWWRQATVYQIYPRSFCDSNGDGIGDLQGIISKAGYLRDLGVDAIWLSPFYPSPLKDGGYDVADYRDVDPRIGSLEDFDEMTSKLKEVGIKVIVDIVPNHCSEDHVWFQEAIKSPVGSEARSKFIFRDGLGANKSEPPNDWQCLFGGAAWTQLPPNADGTPGQFYFHLFDSSQPDFDWNHPAVLEDFLKTLRFWGDRGVAGFRVDVAMGCMKDMSEPFASAAELKRLTMEFEKTKGTVGDHPLWDRDEVHAMYKKWREVFNEYNPPLTAVAEAWVAPHRQHLYASPEGLGQAFSFDMLMCDYSAKKIKETIGDSLKLAGTSGSSTTWVLSNHDVVRHATRYGIPGCTDGGGVDNWNKPNSAYLLSGGKEPACDKELGLKRARAATLSLLGLPGSAYIYQGEELGLPEVVDIPAEQRQDPTFFRHKGAEIGRDGCRVPIPWSSTAGPTFGYSPADATAKPHLPMPEWFGEYAADVQGAGSTLEMYTKALKLRRELQAEEKLQWIGEEEGVVRYRRPGGWEVVFNVSNEEGVEVNGEVLISSGEIKGGKVGKDTTVWSRVKE